jgi:ligand-binding SRPBCC domain-containing protein
MSFYTLHREMWVPHPLPVVFDFFSRAENLQQITPPWMLFRILTPSPIVMKPGATLTLFAACPGHPHTLVHGNRAMESTFREAKRSGVQSSA